jgi:hypothetical protein
MTLLERLARTKNLTLLALINPYRNPDNDASEVDKHHTSRFRKSAFRKTGWDKKA